MAGQNTNGYKPTIFPYIMSLYVLLYILLQKKVAKGNKRKRFGGYISQSPIKKHAILRVDILCTV